MQQGDLQLRVRRDVLWNGIENVPLNELVVLKSLVSKDFFQFTQRKYRDRQLLRTSLQILINRLHPVWEIRQMRQIR